MPFVRTYLRSFIFRRRKRKYIVRCNESSDWGDNFNPKRLNAVLKIDLAVRLVDVFRFGAPVWVWKFVKHGCSERLKQQNGDKNPTS